MPKLQREGSASGRINRGKRMNGTGSMAPASPEPTRNMDGKDSSLVSDVASETEGAEVEHLDQLEPVSVVTTTPGSGQVPGKPHGSVEALVATTVEVCFRVVGLMVAFYLAPQRYAWRLFVQVVALTEAILGRFLKWSGVQTAAEKKAEIRAQEVHRLQGQLGRLRDRHQDAQSKIEQLKRDKAQLQADLRKLQEATDASMPEDVTQGDRSSRIPITGHRTQPLLHLSVAFTSVSTYFFFHHRTTTDPYKAYLLLGMCGMIAWLYISSMRMRVASRWNSIYTMCLSWFITTYIWAAILWSEPEPAANINDAWATVVSRQ